MKTRAACCGRRSRIPDPVLIFEHVMLYNVVAPLAADAGAVPIDKAAIRRAGTHVSLITYGGSLPKAMKAADELAKQGIEAEVDRSAHAAAARRRDHIRIRDADSPRGDRR